MADKHTPATEGLALALTKIQPALVNELNGVPPDSAFFNMVQARAARVLDECATGKMRKRLPVAEPEMTALLEQAITDLNAVIAEQLDATVKAQTQAQRDKVEIIKDALAQILKQPTPIP